MKITVEFDLSTEEGKADFEDFKNMRRNARFWDEIYDEVFRNRIKYPQHPETTEQYRDVWCEVKEFMDSIEK